MQTDTTDVDQVAQANHTGYAAMKAVWQAQRESILAVRAALDAASGGSLNPNGAVELHRLIEAIDRNDAIYR